jgi:hypothetical protein
MAGSHSWLSSIEKTLEFRIINVRYLARFSSFIVITAGQEHLQDA